MGISQFLGEYLHPTQWVYIKPAFPLHMACVIVNDYGDMIIEELESIAKCMRCTHYLRAHSQKRISYYHTTNYMCYIGCYRAKI